MAEEARGVRLCIVAMLGKMLFEQFVGNNANLKEAVHAFTDLHLDVIL